MLEYNEFNNICRTCSSNNNLILLQNNPITRILEKITSINFSENPDYPQQICTLCTEKLNDIETFLAQITQNEAELTETYLKHKTQQIKQEPAETVFIKIENIEIPDLNSAGYGVYDVTEATITTGGKIKKENIEIPVLNSSCDSYDVTEDPLTTGILKKFTCETCNKCFTKLNHLHRHRLIHTGLRPYKCDTCEKSFTQSGDLKKHERIHTGVKPYKCDLCDKAFNNSSDLIKHRRLHTGEKPYKCPVCEKAFRQSNDLIKHKKTHEKLLKRASKLPKHECDFCLRRFRGFRDLNRHRNGHLKEQEDCRTFECEICNKGFKQSTHLRDHMRIHTGERPYSCEVCCKTFVQASNLKSHQKKHLCLKTENISI